jgi:multiple sugar transport system substrate-binding protein
MAEKYGTRDGKWIAMPIGASGGRVVYRKSWLNEAGYDAVPTDLDGFLQLCRKLKANGHPAGLALGNAVGDGNAWCHWVVWAHGGAMVDENDQVIINSPETIEALKYAKALYETFIPGTLSWLDPANNKAFLAGEIGLTQNGISIYYAAKNSEDANVRALAEDIYHAKMPIGPVGTPTERALVLNQMVFAYSKYPNAAKEFLRFMMEHEQYDPYLNACIGYWNHPLQAYDASAVWTADPKHEPFKHVLKDALWDSYRGTIRPESAAVLADFVIVQMVASVCAGQATPEAAAAEADRRIRRYYRT